MSLVAPGRYYLDSGASHWNITHNVATNSPKAFPYIIAGYNINQGARATCDAHDNTIDHLWFQHTDGLTKHTPGPGIPECRVVADASTLFNCPVGQPLPVMAQDIMAAAGAL